MSKAGRVEILSSEFASGWAEYRGDNPISVYAKMDDGIIGVARADIKRADLERAFVEQELRAGCFVIVYNKPVPEERMSDVTIHVLETNIELKRAAAIRIDRQPKQQIFVFGSPRSGTSELGDTLAKQLRLPWLGEGHAAPLFARAASSLSGDGNSANGLVRFMWQQDYALIAVEAMKRAYFHMHGSASFVDKTPGVPMIEAAPFLASAFPAGKFICLRRNGISNVLSRMTKFGGSFEGHCSDWVAAIDTWQRVKANLPHCLELEQETMMDDPTQVGSELAGYLGVPELSVAIQSSLKTGSRERTGAGLGRKRLSDTGWTEAQLKAFIRICGRTMENAGYSLD